MYLELIISELKSLQKQDDIRIIKNKLILMIDYYENAYKCEEQLSPD
jgi:hypothetical protein